MGCQSSSSPEPESVQHTYAASRNVPLNPERGFFTPYELPGPAGFSSVRLLGNTLVHLNIRLDDWRETDIPQGILDSLDVNFADIRHAGVKAIIRFAYNKGPYPDSEPDASKAQILRHIKQLTPLLRKNSDVIAWVEAGFIGAWGEWHTSTNGLDNITDKQEILNALLAAIPDRFVQVRYPANIIEMYPDPMDAAKARVAHHNDCFVSSNTDVGTYERDGVITIERDQKYLAELTRFTPMSGETCAPNPPRSECASALQEMNLLHVTALNEGYHKGILRSWEQGGCMENIKMRLGYHFTLTGTVFNEEVRPGGILNLTVQLQNTGFANLVNERPVYIILIGQGAEPYSVKLDIDPRRWEFGNSSFNVKLHIPSNAPEGEYRIALWLPDASESLRDNQLYAIQFADDNMWDESTGYNLIGTLRVDKTVTGNYQRGDKFDVLESTVLTEGDVPTEVPMPTSTVISGDSSLISNLEISNTADNVLLSFDYVSGNYNAVQLLVDVDQNPNTGYRINGIGAEALFENDTWNIYAGTGTEWNWEPTEALIPFENTRDHINWNLPRSLLNSLKFDFVLQFVDANWNSVFISEKETYIIQ